MVKFLLMIFVVLFVGCNEQSQSKEKERVAKNDLVVKDTKIKKQEDATAKFVKPKEYVRFIDAYTDYRKAISAPSKLHKEEALKQLVKKYVGKGIKVVGRVKEIKQVRKFKDNKVVSKDEYSIELDMALQARKVLLFKIEHKLSDYSAFKLPLVFTKDKTQALSVSKGNFASILGVFGSQKNEFGNLKLIINANKIERTVRADYLGIKAPKSFIDINSNDFIEDIGLTKKYDYLKPYISKTTYAQRISTTLKRNQLKKQSHIFGRGVTHIFNVNKETTLSFLFKYFETMQLVKALLENTDIKISGILGNISTRYGTQISLAEVQISFNFENSNWTIKNGLVVEGDCYEKLVKIAKACIVYQKDFGRSVSYPWVLETLVEKKILKQSDLQKECCYLYTQREMSWQDPYIIVIYLLHKKAISAIFLDVRGNSRFQVYSKKQFAQLYNKRLRYIRKAKLLDGKEIEIIGDKGMKSKE